MWLLLLLLLFAVSAVGPGLFVVRRLRLGPPERLVASVTISFAFVFLATFAVYLLNVDRRWHVAISFACLVLTLLCSRDLIRLFRHHQTRRIALCWLAFLAWGLLLLAFVRNYAGGTWSVDWLEHYHRALFFLQHRPHDTLLGGIYPLPARPPAMNLIATDFLAQVDSSYDVYQVLALFLNSLVLLPCCLVARNFFSRSGRNLPWLVLLLLAANPMVAQNLTYSWTRLFTAFYVVLGVHLYLRGWRKGSTPHTVLAFVSLSVGFLVHFSAGPFAAFVGLHYAIITFWRRKRRFAEALTIAATCAAVLAPYLVWSSIVYGPRATFASNSTVSGQNSTAKAGRPRDVLQNVGRTLLPPALWNPAIMQLEEVRQRGLAGHVRDQAFLVYQQGYPWAVGSAGMILAGVLLLRGVRGRTPSPPYAGERAGVRSGTSSTTGTGQDPSPPTPPAGSAPHPSPLPRVRGRGDRSRWFWAGFVPTTFVLGIAVNPGTDRFGVAHICLQPLVLLTLAFVAAGLPRLPLRLRWLIVPGLLLDFALGIFLHFTLQNREYALVETPAGYALRAAGDVLSHASQANARYKIAPVSELIKDPDPILLEQGSLLYVGDYFGGLLLPLQVALAAGLALLMWKGLRPHLLPARVTRRTGPSERTPEVEGQRGPRRRRQPRSGGRR